MIRVGLIFSIFLILGAFFIISNNNLHLSDKKEADIFGRMYFDWIVSLVSNFKGITGYFTLDKILPGNFTNSSFQTGYINIYSIFRK